MDPTVPCSHYCKPEEGLHTYVAWTNTTDIDALRRQAVGTRRMVTGPGIYDCCYHLPALIEAVDFQPAVEFNGEPLEPDLTVPVLITVRVLPAEIVTLEEVDGVLVAKVRGY